MRRPVAAAPEGPLRLDVCEAQHYSLKDRAEFSLRRADGKAPFNVVLLDEIEKAHCDILNLFLQLLDEGMLLDAEGNPAFFRSSIVIMTSNV